MTAPGQSSPEPRTPVSDGWVTDVELREQRYRELVEAAGPPTPEQLARLRQIFRAADERRAAERARGEAS